MSFDYKSPTSGSDDVKANGAARRFVRNLVESLGEQSKAAITARLDILSAYIASQYDGAKDVSEVAALKGMCREWEAECLWGHIGVTVPEVKHLRLGFYTNDMFAPEPTHARDAQPMIDVMAAFSPDILTVTIDP